MATLVGIYPVLTWGQTDSEEQARGGNESFRPTAVISRWLETQTL